LAISSSLSDKTMTASSGRPMLGRARAGGRWPAAARGSPGSPEEEVGEVQKGASARLSREFNIPVVRMPRDRVGHRAASFSPPFPFAPCSSVRLAALDGPSTLDARHADTGHCAIFSKRLFAHDRKASPPTRLSPATT